MKLLVVASYFPPSVGGVQNYVFNISKGLMKDYNYEIVVITSNHESPKKYKEEKLEGMKIYRLPYQFKISNTPISFKWKKQIKEIIEKEKPDVINAHMPVPFISDVACRVAHKLKIPFVLTYHSGSMIKEKGFFKNIIIYFYELIILKKTLDYSINIICCSDFVRLDFLRNYKNKSLTITPGVNINVFKSLKLNSKNNILFVANLKKSEEYKGLSYLLKSVKLIKKKNQDIKLNIVGDGDGINYYKKMVNVLDIEDNVIFLGKIKGRGLNKEYNKTNILILPSLIESFGMVLIEAMACKKPVIGSNIGGIPYVIDNGKDGLLVPPKDPQALADAIIKILNNPKLAKRMGENGYKKVKENFTWDISAKKMNETIQGVLR